MSEVEVEVYCLSYLEVQVLAAQVGIEELYGFSVQNSNKIDKKTMIEVVYKMTKKNILYYQTGVLAIQKDYQKLFLDIRGASKVMVIKHKQEDIPKKCCYVNEQLLVSEISETRENVVQFYYQEKNRFMDMLEEGRYLPREYVEEKDLVLEKWDKSFESSEEVFSLPQVLCCIQFTDMNQGNEDSWIAIFEGDLTEYLVFKEKDDIYRISYNRNYLEKQLYHMMER